LIEHSEIIDVVTAYLERYPEDQPRLAPLVASLDAKTAVTERATFTGHVTCSVALIDRQRRVLHIRHNTLGLWLPPGGHLEPTDPSLLGAALRELAEETGISADLVTAAPDAIPVDIDVHTIPANPGRGEPEHQHFDLHYVLAAGDLLPQLTLQVEEVSGYRWIPVDEIQPEALRQRLLA
jgi:8-oxo-dGTP pyrophosphatase MutT (NUDIX family)